MRLGTGYGEVLMDWGLNPIFRNNLKISRLMHRKLEGLVWE